MKTKLLLIFFFFFGLLSYGQYSEFKVYDNGLIYSENAVAKLKYIVDSLNLKFKVCDLSQKFYAVEQSKAHYFNLEKKDAAKAKEDILKNISYADFRKKYPKAKVNENLLVTKSEFTDYNDEKITEYNNIGLKRGDENSISFDATKKEDFIHGKWVFIYSEKTDYFPEEINGYYICDDFQKKALPQKYGKLIQYSDCLVDTTAQVFRESAIRSGVRYYDTIPSKSHLFTRYIDNVLKRPDFDHKSFDTFIGMDTIDFEKPFKKLTKKKRLERAKKLELVEIRYRIFKAELDKWNFQKSQRIDSLKQYDPQFMKMFSEAFEEAKTDYKSDDEFETYVGQFVSKEAELELKRNRRVIGGCSMDMMPRIHAQNIALLSAETTKWEIFLRSHLDIMNDRFERVSDGSYALQGRQTYIKELEELNINVIDLLLGVSLRFQDAPKNHYFGSINRIGRAISESKDREDFESAIITMIADDELDDYNRILMYFLMDNYAYNLKDNKEKQQAIAKLNDVVEKLPKHISSKIEIKKI